MLLIFSKVNTNKVFYQEQKFYVKLFCPLIFNRLRYISCEKFYKARQSFTCISKFAPI